MNKRIQELAEQAGAYVNEVYTPPVRSKTPGKIWEDGHIGWHEQFHKKFAELIVQSILNSLETEREYYANPGTYQSLEYYDKMSAKEDALSDAISLIRNDFGVEQ